MVEKCKSYFLMEQEKKKNQMSGQYKIRYNILNSIQCSVRIASTQIVIVGLRANSKKFVQKNR